MKRSTEALETERREVTARITQLRSLDILTDVRLEKAAAAGTAGKKSQTDYKYARLRAGRGRLLENGLKSKYVPLDQVVEVEAAIARGRELEKLTRRLAKLDQMLS
jgi:hypothetical protein